MLSHAEVEAIRLRGNEDVDALMAHIDALETFRARVLTVARRGKAALDELIRAEVEIPGTIAHRKADDAYHSAMLECSRVLLALAEEAGDA